MTLAYTPPGTTVQELTTPTLTPLLALPGSICLVGMSAGSLTQTDTIILNGTVPTPLPGVPAGATMATTAISSIIDKLTPSIAPDGFNPTTDYTFNHTNFTIARQVTAQTLATDTLAGATSFTLSSGAVPAAGQVVSVSNLIASFTGTLNSTNIVSSVSSFTNLAVGQTVHGTGIPGGTTIAYLNPGQNTLTLSNGATASASGVALTANSTETIIVDSVTGQVVTIHTPSTGLVYAHTASGSTVTWGPIPDGDAVYVTYSYTPADYFQPIRLTSVNDIQARFGDALDPTGTVINSPISYAANFAFQNGASNVVIQPLYVVTAGVRQQPTAVQAAAAANWATVYNNLLDLDDVNIIVPVSGQSQPNVTDNAQLAILTATQDFIYAALVTDGRYAVAIFSEDSSASGSVATEPTMIAHAQTLAPRYGGKVTQQCVFVNTSSFSASNAVGSLEVGGQYVAAGIAGMLSARIPAASLTRQAINGFLSVTDTRTPAGKNTDAANGMLVVENKGSVVQVRHGITMDGSSVITRELNVVRGKHFVIATVAGTIDSQVIGIVVADANAPTLVNNVVIAALEDLRGAGDIVGYTGVQSQLVALDPTSMLVRFSYQPVFIVNYVTIQFSLDLTSGTLSVTSGTVSNS